MMKTKFLLFLSTIVFVFACQKEQKNWAKSADNSCSESTLKTINEQFYFGKDSLGQIWRIKVQFHENGLVRIWRKLKPNEPAETSSGVYTHSQGVTELDQEGRQVRRFVSQDGIGFYFIPFNSSEPYRQFGTVYVWCDCEENGGVRGYCNANADPLPFGGFVTYCTKYFNCQGNCQMKIRIVSGGNSSARFSGVVIEAENIEFKNEK